MGHNLVDDGLGVALPVLGADGMPVKAPRGGLGRWSSTSTPHRGWLPGDPAFFNFTDTLDVDGTGPVYPDEQLYFGPEGWRGQLGCICEMCEMARILKIVKLEHPDFPRPLYVGEDCGAYMIGDPSLPIADDADPADIERIRKIVADAKWYRRLDYEGGAEWEPSTRPIYKRRRYSKTGWDDGVYRRAGSSRLVQAGTEPCWVGSMHGFDLLVWPVRGGWRGSYTHRAADSFTRKSGIYPSREAAQRVTRRAALIAKRTKPWKGEGELLRYQAELARRLSARES